MQLNQLRYVIKISECGSFSAAAKELFITQPSLSQQIIKLETELGVKLFDRSSSHLCLTEAGAAFVKNAQMALCHFDEIGRDMERYRAASRELLHLGVMRSLQHRHIIHRIIRVKEQFPRVALDLVYRDSAALGEMLAEGWLDAAFLLPSDAQGIGGIVVRELPYRFYALVSPKNPLSRRPSIGLRDMKGQRFILPEQNNYIFSELVHLISQVEMDVEIYLPKADENPLDERSIGFVAQGGAVPEKYRDCDIVPVEFFDLYGICLAIQAGIEQNQVVRELFKLFS